MTVPITLNNVITFQNDTTAANTVNSNSTAITTAFGASLDTAGDQMHGNLDMNNNRLLNLPTPVSGNEPLRLTDASTLNGGGTITTGITSAALTLPADFTVSGSPITGLGGTITASWANTPTGTGGVVRATSPTISSPTLTTPALGTPASGVATNLTGTAAGLTAGSCTTIPNLSGPITSAGNVTSVGSQTGTGSQFVMAASPTITTPGIVGVTTGTNATAGNVGEFISSTIPTASSVTLTNAAVSNVTSINLTAGDWDVWGSVAFTAAATTSVTILIGSITTTSGGNGLPGATGSSISSFTTPAEVPGNAFDPTYVLTVPQIRLNLSSTTTVFLTADTNFTVSTLKAYGFIAARRVR